jgi:hypothetical protein
VVEAEMFPVCLENDVKSTMTKVGFLYGINEELNLRGSQAQIFVMNINPAWMSLMAER